MNDSDRVADLELVLKQVCSALQTATGADTEVKTGGDILELITRLRDERNMYRDSSPAEIAEVAEAATYFERLAANRLRRALDAEAMVVRLGLRLEWLQSAYTKLNIERHAHRDVVESTQRHLDQMRRERDNAKGQLANEMCVGQSTEGQLHDVEAERDKFRDVVTSLNARFVDHLDSCATKTDYPCDCGLDEVFAELAKEATT